MTGEPCRIGIMFGDVCDSTRLYETYGDQIALVSIEHCIKAMTEAVRENGGTVVKLLGDEVMAKFEAPDAMISAARAMQEKVSSLMLLPGPYGGTQLQIRVGLHFGSAIQDHSDFFGDMVNVAARLADVAKAGQIITTPQLLELLPASDRGVTRDLNFISVKGKAEPVRVVEVIWRDTSDMTFLEIRHKKRPAIHTTLRLEQGQRVWVFDADHNRITLGREATNDLVLLNPRVSRKHATIERRRDKWVLIDHSTNGSFITFARAERIFLKREELILHKAGVIDLGDPDSGDAANHSNSMCFKLL